MPRHLSTRRWIALITGCLAAITAMLSASAPTDAVAASTHPTPEVRSHGATLAAPDHTWRVTPIDGSFGGSFRGVACARRERCFAIARNRHVLSWSGGDWKGTTVPTADATHVACASSTFCLVVSKGIVERWNGSDWAQVRTPPKDFFPNDTTCTAPTFCMTVGIMRPRAAYLLDGKVTAVGNPDPAADTRFFVGSCTSPTFCLIGGMRMYPKPAEWIWNGTSVARITPPPTLLSALSCTSRSFCIGIGSRQLGRAHVFEWRGRENGWTPIPPPRPAAGRVLPVGVDCVSRTACEMVGRHYTPYPKPTRPIAWRWDGKTWTTEPVPLPAGVRGGSLKQVDCVSAAVCTAVGGNGRHALAVTTAS